MTRLLAVLLLAGALPLPAGACLPEVPDLAGLDGPCRSDGGTGPQVALPGDLTWQGPRPPARPDHGPTIEVARPTGDAAVAQEDPLLSPQAALFWDAA